MPSSAGALPLSRTRPRQSQEKDADDEPLPSRITKTIAKRNMSASTSGKSHAACTITIRDPKMLDDFYIYLHRRMCVRVEMHGDNTVLKNRVPPPPSDPILDLVTSGNAYRHLDRADSEEGAAYRRLAGVTSMDSVSATQFEELLMMCLVRMSGMNEQRMQQWLGKLSDEQGGLHGRRSAKGGKGGKDGKGGGDALDAVASTKAEALHLADFLFNEGFHFTEPTMFAEAGFQVQGAKRWADSLRTWFGVRAEDQSKYPDGKWPTLASVACRVRAATTWKEANVAVQALTPVGPYTGAQALCTLLCASQLAASLSHSSLLPPPALSHPLPAHATLLPPDALQAPFIGIRPSPPPPLSSSSNRRCLRRQCVLLLQCVLRRELDGSVLRSRHRPRHVVREDVARQRKGPEVRGPKARQQGPVYPEGGARLYQLAASQR